MHIFFSVGEPSGDQHAAHLIRELKRRHPDIQFSGYGGPLMDQAGCRLNYRLTDLAVMGILHVIPLLWRFYRLVREARQFFEESRPDAVVLVDFPGFNWWIARKAKAAGIPVFYYLPPQLWAWASWRIRRVRKFVDHVLCALPFEQKWYAQRGVAAEYVGHPFFDEVADHRLDPHFCKAWQIDPHAQKPHLQETGFAPLPQGVRNIGILPGSRNHEVTRNWPLMLEVMKNLHARHPDIRFLVACYKQAHRDACAEQLPAEYARLPIHWFVGKTPEIIETADCCLMVSGSVSLEMLARRTPAVVLYRCGWFVYPLLRMLVRPHFESITLPNLIASRRILPEWVIVYSPKRDIRAMTAVLDGWLSDRRQLDRVATELTDLRREVGQTGATGRAADAILARLAPSLAPHHGKAA